MNLMRKFAALLIVLVGSIASLQAETIGTVPLGSFDTYDGNGNVFIYNGSPLFTVAGTAASFEFICAPTGFPSTMTPLLFEKVSSSEFVVRGVGSPFTSDGNIFATQSGLFTLVAGSASVDVNYTFGYIDATVSSNGGGGVNIDSYNRATITTHVNGGPWLYTDSRNNGATAFPIGTINPGTYFSSSTGLAPILQNGSAALPYRVFTGRTYEMNMTSTVIPEPSSILIFVMGLGAMATLIYRRNCRVLKG